jgi:serpin B
MKKENYKTTNNKNNRPKTQEANKNIKNPPNQATHKIKINPLNQAAQKIKIHPSNQAPQKIKIHPPNQATQKITNPPINQAAHKIIAQTPNKESDNFQIIMLQEINKSNIGKNIMISPLSIYHILSLTANGAENKTLREMLKVLCQRNKIELNKNNELISSSIAKLKSVELANAIFTKFKPLDNFMKKVKDYKATIDQLINEAQINKWCCDATHKKIPVIIDKLTDDDLMVLINAIYFKGFWKEKFDKKLTDKDQFMNCNKEPKEVDFMHITKKFDYFEDKELQAISLNYQKDHLKALIILPNPTIDINTYIKDFTIEKYTKILKKLVNIKVIFSLPKFEIQFKAELKNIFTSLGMIEPFSDNADFSVMRKEKDIKIAKIIHKTFIKIDERGTEAAAVTAVVMMKTLACVNKKPDPIMNVDRPFLFIIRSNDLPSGQDMLFVSKVEFL